MAAPRWAAVVVNYRAGPDLLACALSLFADDSAGVPEVVVVDNGSDDGSVDLLRASLPQVPVINAGANLGYARAANLGTAATDAPIVAVLNPDTEVARGTGAAMLARFDADPSLGALGPRLENPDGTRYPSARRAPGLGTALGHATLGRVSPSNRWTRDYLQLEADPDARADVDWLSGAAIWLRREALAGVGGWDERFFLFFEDVDLCRRLRLDGWGVAYEPAGRVGHRVGASRAERPYRSIVVHHEAAYRYASKWWHGPRRVLLPAAAAFLGARAAIEMTGNAALARRNSRLASG